MNTSYSTEDMLARLSNRQLAEIHRLQAKNRALLDILTELLDAPGATKFLQPGFMSRVKAAIAKAEATN